MTATGSRSGSSEIEGEALMSMVRWVAVAVVAGAAFTPGSVSGHAVDDDLAVVKRATTGEAQAGPDTEKSVPIAKVKGAPATWLKVRVTEKVGKKARVSINVPLALVRALNDECPFDFHVKDHEGTRHKVRLGELLKALDAGQQIVEIDDEESTLRVWVE
jgi:hypothetical protein